ncbi:MAG: DNA polymerase III subunit gamma and tau [Pseudonocardiaceae bacterium]|nr:DNA polymerase III subunit gamma and tau [Pseudonocardiaceae bacterium]
MALALYRKYRPATFAEVVGQEHVTEPLRTALAAGRINHAYLFSGPRGCGKTSCARILARSLNCTQGPTDEPCGECDSCIALAPEGPGSVDVVELDAASHGGVDDARELRDRAFFTPAEAPYRVFIIDEAHMVTTQGFNALLKIVEEPPEHLIFIFATTEPDKVLNTIRSRTHHYPFRLIPPGAMRELLERNCAAEGIPVEPAVYPLVVRAGGGSARDTQSVLDQLLAGAGPDGISYERAVALLGVTDVALIDDMVDGLAAEDGAAVFGTVEKLVEAGHDPRRFASDLLDRLRDLVLLRSVPDAAGRGLVAAPDDELTRMQAQTERLGLATLARYAEIVHTGLTDMRGATSPRLLLELLCARMLLPAADESEAAVLHRLERLERRMTVAPTHTEEPAPPQREQRQQGRPQQERPRREQRQPEQPQPEQRQQAEAAESATPAEPAQPTGSGAAQPAAEPEPAAESAATEPEPQPEPERAQPSPAPAALDATAVRRVWSDLLAVIRKTSRSTEAMLTNATVHSVEDSTVVLSHTAAPLARRLSEQRNVDVIANALHEVLGGQWQVRCIPADQAGSATPQPSSQGQSGGQARAQSRAPQAAGRETDGPPSSGSHAGAPSGPQASAPAGPQAGAPSPPQASSTPAGPSSPPSDDIPLPPEPEPDEYDQGPAATGPRTEVPRTEAPGAPETGAPQTGVAPARSSRAGTAPAPSAGTPSTGATPTGAASSPTLGGRATSDIGDGPEHAVHQLLSDQLGARPLDDP